MKKTTDELNNEIKEATDIHSYLEENQEEIRNKESLACYLNQLRDERKLSISNVIACANVSVSFTYAIFGAEKLPSRKMLLRILLGMCCTQEEINKALKLAGYKELYPRDKQDACILFCLNKKLGYEETWELLESEEITLLDE